MFADEDGEPDPQKVMPFLSEAGLDPGVDIEQGPGGDLFFASLYGNAIHRISYDPGAPQARLTVDQAWGPVGHAFNFDAGGSTGPAGDTLTYEWDLDGDGSFNNGGGIARTETYSTASNVAVAVKVNDVDTGKSSIARLTVYPGDSPPAVQIKEPATTLTWGVGQPIHLAGSAKAEAGSGSTIPRNGLYWNTRLLHCPFGPTQCHEHPLQVFPAKESGEFPAPEHDYPSYPKISLTATDGRGQSATSVVKIAARPVALNLASNPPDITLTAGLKIEAAPFELLAIENSPTTIAAPGTAVLKGIHYAFQGWSDGGARVHTVLADKPASHTANYVATSGPPATTHRRPKIHKHPPKRTRSRTARFAFGGEKGLRFHCKLDGKKYASCHSPRVFKRLKPGKHTFRVLAVDSSGAAVTKVTSFSWRILPPNRAAREGRRYSATIRVCQEGSSGRS